MDINRSIREATEVIRLQGRFDYQVRSAFQQTVKSAVENTSASEIQIDLGGVNHVDSSALGMLILLRIDAESAGKTVVLTRATERVMGTLRIANFESFFNFK